MTLKDQLLQNPSLTLENNLFYQKELSCANPFEKKYLAIREKENRVYSDGIVKHLPDISNDHPLINEWRARKASLKKLISFLKKKDHRTILELGCGNGWLSHNVAISLKSEVCGMDVNEAELLQSVRIFSQHKNLSFIYADIFTVQLEAQLFDTIILASSIQYFSKVDLLINRLLKLLQDNGEIYIIDSPFYTTSLEAVKAQQRSIAYFTNAGIPEMADQFHHYTFDIVKDFKPYVLYNEKSILNKLQRKIFKNTPAFPIIQIKK